MIYLRPIGGLCNRIRTIDSLLSICRLKKRDLTVLWVKDGSLNSSFSEIFQIPNFDEFNLQIIDCPEGYPEKYVDSSLDLINAGKIENEREHFFLRKAKNIIRKSRLNNEQYRIKNILQILNSDAIITNGTLSSIYNSGNQIENKSVTDMDSLFIPKAFELFNSKLYESKNFYISSCYRIYPIENQYTSFVPVADIMNKVEENIKNFHETIGLHIRRSDHTTSKAISTTEKFLRIVEICINKNSEATFFVSTDDAETKLELVSRFGDKIITNDVSSYDRSDENAVKDAMVDLYCLSKTQKIYGSHHSSFSQTASHIGNIEEITAK